MKKKQQNNDFWEVGKLAMLFVKFILAEENHYLTNRLEPYLEENNKSNSRFCCLANSM